MTEVIQNVFDAIADPFWYWLFVGSCAVLLFTLAAWYFGFLRPIAGIVFVAVVSGLFGFRKGEQSKVDRGKTNAAKSFSEDRPPSIFPWFRL